MTPEQISRLFRPFTQAGDSTTRQFGGTGLGLTICRRLVELLGGEIEVTSVPGQGSSFEFHVPTGSLTAVSMIASPSESTKCEDISPTQRSEQARVTVEERERHLEHLIFYAGARSQGGNCRRRMARRDFSASPLALIRSRRVNRLLRQTHMSCRARTNSHVVTSSTGVMPKRE